MENNFDGLEYLHILGGKNEVADDLAKFGSHLAMVLPRIFMQELHEPSITKALAKASKAVESSQETTPPVESTFNSPEVMEIHLEWCTPFMIYLRTMGFPEDKDECERLRCQIGHYTLVNHELFWQSANDTLMQCILPEE
jgi:hypothetical protein